MTTVDKIVGLGRVLGHFTLLGVFMAGAVMMNAFLWTPQAITGPMGKFGREMGNLTVQMPPYVWLGFTVEQLMIFGTLLDVIGVLGLMNFPKLAASLVFIMTGWQQMFYRLNTDKLPYHPLCGYTSPHCPTVDIVRLSILIAAVFVFTAPLPLPETTLAFLKQLGIGTQWMDSKLKKVREYMPLHIPVRTSPVVRQAQDVVGGKTKET